MKIARTGFAAFTSAAALGAASAGAATMHPVLGAKLAGMVVAKLGDTYKAKSCAAVPTKALELIESKPASYRVWVDTKAHMGELRGTLMAGMAHMANM